MYQDDSFYTLSQAGQIGLVGLSLVLTAILLLLAWRMMGSRPLSVRIAIAIILFLAFVWLSPQIYYTYYLFLFDGLPLQIVILPPPGPQYLADLVFFQDRTTLSAHSKGILGWLLLLVALLKPRFSRSMTH